MKNIVENGGNVSRAMLDAGYSPATAKTPQKLTESKSWEQLLEEYLPDDVLTQKIQEGIDASREIIIGDNKLDVPEYAIRHKYVETALKLKNKFPDVGIKHKGDKNNPLQFELSDDQLKRILSQ